MEKGVGAVEGSHVEGFVVVDVEVETFAEHIEAVELVEDFNEADVVFGARDADVALETGGEAGFLGEDDSCHLRVCC